MNTKKPRNEEDFQEYYNITISVNKYIDRLIDELAKYMSLSRSQVIRNAIYEKYQNEKESIKEMKELHNRPNN